MRRINKQFVALLCSFFLLSRITTQNNYWFIWPIKQQRWEESNTSWSASSYLWKKKQKRKEKNPYHGNQNFPVACNRLLENDFPAQSKHDMKGFGGRNVKDFDVFEVFHESTLWQNTKCMWNNKLPHMQYSWIASFVPM